MKKNAKIIAVKKNTAKKQSQAISETPAPTEKEIKVIRVLTSEIDYSPLNHRRHYNEDALNSFAEELKRDDIFSPLEVRKKPVGRYELVFGERRLRAAKIGGLETVPVILKDLTDEQVIERQLLENLQREDPHPMDYAYGIERMQTTGLSMDEISSRLGKTKPFIYNRIKLNSLLPVFQEMFLAGKISHPQALAIAAVSNESQQELYDKQCIKWKENKNFHLNNLNYLLSRFTYDLKAAPFNTKDKKLLPDVCACAGCTYNTATLKSLFSEFAKQAICNNKECYHKKCTAHYSIVILNAFAQQTPAALLYKDNPPDILETIFKLVPTARDLPTYHQYQVTIPAPPQAPDKEDFSNEWEVEDGAEPEFDEAGYSQAIEEFNTELEEYDQFLQSGKLLNGLFISENEIKMMQFLPEAPKANSGTSVVTAKEVQTAIMNGKATPELLEAEIKRIQTKEKRSQELDREKVQLNVHTEFSNHISDLENPTTLTPADLIGARLLIYQSLDRSSRNKVDEVLLGELEEREADHAKRFYETLGVLTDQQYSFLIRMAIVGKSDSKYPRAPLAYCLYQMAESSGVNTKAIELKQQDKITNRQKKQTERIEELAKKIKKLNKPIPSDPAT